MNSKTKILIGVLVIVLVLIFGWLISNNQQIPIQQSKYVEISIDEKFERISYVQLPIDKTEAETIVKKFCEPKKQEYRYGYKLMKKINNAWRMPLITINGPYYATVNAETGKTVCMKEIPFENQQVTLTTDKTEYEQGETVKIMVKNNVDKEILIFIPFYVVERLNNGDWIKIKRVLCPCGTRCKLATYFILQANKTMEYNWDQMESWCSGPKISETISNQVPAGKYRIKSITSDPNQFEGKQTIYSNKFTIKEKSAIDPLCSKEIVGKGDCSGAFLGYVFDQSKEKCVEKGVSGCSIETPFNSLEECQMVCEKNDIRGGTSESKCKELGGFVTCDSTPEGTELDCLCCFNDHPNDCRYVK